MAKEIRIIETIYIETPEGEWIETKLGGGKDITWDVSPKTQQEQEEEE